MFLYRSKENKNYSRQCHKMSHLDLEHLMYVNTFRKENCVSTSTNVLRALRNYNEEKEEEEEVKVEDNRKFTIVK